MRRSRLTASELRLRTRRCICWSPSAGWLALLGLGGWLAHGRVREWRVGSPLGKDQHTVARRAAPRRGAGLGAPADVGGAAGTRIRAGLQQRGGRVDDLPS
jgi:hypothetical protein